MNKRFITFIVMLFTFCIVWANQNPVEKLCNVKIKSLEVVNRQDNSILVKVCLKNFSDKAYLIDLSYQILEATAPETLLKECIKAQQVEIKEKEEKFVDIISPINNLKPKTNYKLNVILTYKPEVFIGFFNNDKIIDEKNVIFSQPQKVEQKD